MIKVSRASVEKVPGRGVNENQDRETVPISLLLLYQWRVRGRNGHMTRAHLKGTLHQEPRVKIKTFFGETPIFSKMSTFL